MLAGRSAFSGETATDIFVSILERGPDWTALPADMPPAIQRLLRRCLEKDVRRRLRDIGDARLEIEEALVHSAETATPTRGVAAREVQFSRLTDFVGHEESPAISPDGKMVAFVATGRRPTANLGAHARRRRRAAGHARQRGPRQTAMGRPTRAR